MRHSVSSVAKFLLIVACIAVLGLIVLGWGLSGVINHTHNGSSRAKNDCVQLANAIKMFYTEYDRYAVSLDAVGEGPLESNRRLMDVLMNIRNDPDVAELNPRGIAFFEPSRVARKPDGHGYVHETGAFNDPWGTPYRVYIDLDMDGKITLPSMYRKKGASPLVEKAVIVHSAGKDRDFDKIRDNVKSWE